MLRAHIWVAFIIVAFIAAFLFAGVGHGSYAPFAVFYGWGTLAEWGLAKLGGNSQVVEAVVFFGVPILYPLGLGLALRYVVQRWGMKFYGAVIVLHTVGVVLAATQIEHGHLATPALVQFSFLVSSAILVLLFALDYAVLDQMLKQRDGTPSVEE